MTDSGFVSGDRLAHITIRAPIGAGGMGVVYRAWEERLLREVALKVLPSETTADPNARERLLREARSAASLDHPNICTVHDVDEDAGRAFIAMEMVDGRSLHALRAAEHFPPERVIRIGVAVADALAREQSGDHAGAVASLEHGVKLDENNDNLAQLAHAYGTAGRRADALRAIEQLKQRRASGFVPAGDLALAYAGIPEPDSAFHWLELGVQDHSEVLTILGVEPAFDPLRRDPRFATILARVNLRPRP